MLHLIIDLVLLILIAGCAWKGYRRGLIPGVFAILALVVSFYGANLVAETYAGEFTSILEPFISGLVDRAADEAAEAFEAQEKEPDVYEMAFASLRGVGVMKSAAENIAGDLAGEITETGHVLKRALVDKLCAVVAYALALAIVFVLFLIAFTVVGNILNLAFMLPGLELVNGLLGTLFGLAQGLILAFAIAWLLRFTGIAVKEAVVDQTLLLRWLMIANPLTNVFGV